MSKAGLTFDGKHVTWPGHGVFKATSGNVIEDPTTHKTTSFQEAKFQDLADLGPIPEGSYSFLAVDSGTAFDSTGHLDSRQGIERIAAEGTNQSTRRGSTDPHDATTVVADWGHNRVRLNVLHIDHRKAHNRNGFYLHDSHKGHTHGCVEIDHKFFDKLRAFAAGQAKLSPRQRHTTLVLTVKYPSASASTNGGTLF